MDDDDVPAYLEADRPFHHAYIAAVGNALMTEMAFCLRDKMRLYGISSQAGRDRQVASVAEHYRLVEPARAEKAEEAKALLKQHIRSLEPIFADAIQKNARAPIPLRA